MDNYLKQVSENLGAILKKQRGHQYEFGDDIDSDLHVMKIMNQKMLDVPDATNTKSIGNYFGNLDREIRKTSAQGFGKCRDDLVTKYSIDFVDGQHKWQTKANRKIAADLKLKQEVFDKNQNH